MMAVLSADAQGILDRYLRQVRASLRGHSSVDVDDVERDVYGHIDAALSGLQEPIDAGSLRQVLDRLGTPARWVPDDDLPTWRRTASRLWSGPEDWRLPYLTFICFLAGPTLFLVPVENSNGLGGGPLFWPLPLVLTCASFVFARASLAVLAAHDESIATRRWLIYPPLLLWYAPLAVLLFIWPIPVVIAANDHPIVREWTGRLLPTPLWMNATITAAMALGVWWVALGLVIDRCRRAVRATFWPFAEGVARRHAIGVMAAGVTLVILGAVLFPILTRR